MFYSDKSSYRHDSWIRPGPCLSTTDLYVPLRLVLFCHAIYWYPYATNIMHSNHERLVDLVTYMAICFGCPAHTYYWFICIIDENDPVRIEQVLSCKSITHNSAPCPMSPLKMIMCHWQMPRCRLPEERNNSLLIQAEMRFEHHFGTTHNYPLDVGNVRTMLPKEPSNGRNP